MRLIRFLLFLLALGLVAFALYQIPPVQDRLYWGWVQAEAYLRGAINPAGAVPTPEATAAPKPTTTISPPTATPSAPTATPLPSPTPLPERVHLEPPAWEKQDINNCGPASLSTYLRYYGWDGDQFDISKVIKPERPDRNVNVEELAFYAWNYAGWLNTLYRVGGDAELMKDFIANGIPVMIEEGDELAQGYWPDDDQWAGHFLLLTGYDDAAGLFYAQDTFRQQDREVSYEKTDERWKYFNRVFIVVYHPNQEELVRSILNQHWDNEFNRQHALEIAQAEIAVDPEDALAWFNLGSSLVYFERYAEAADAYDEARRLGLPQRMLRYQFGPFHAYFHSLRTEDLMAVTDYALQITPNSEEALLWRGWGLYRQGDNAGAIAAFRKAYQANVNSYDAQYALEFMGVDP